MRVGFSYIGIIWLLALFIPNVIFIKNKPAGYEKLPPEDRILKILEGIGQVGVTMICLISANLNIRPEPWAGWLIASAVVMLMYEIWWIRYFRGEKTLKDLFSSFLGIPVAGAALPVIAFALLAVYGKSPQLGLFVLPLGIGHVGIHLNHKKEISDKGE